MNRKNVIVLHLESVAYQTFNAFPEAFPNINKLTPTSRVFRSYYSSATSTQMVLAYLFHGNDFELDSHTNLEEPAANNPSLFSTLNAAGYDTSFLCASAFSTKKMLPNFADTIPEVWTTNDFSELFSQIEKRTDSQPFAIFCWNLITHMEHANALAGFATGIDDLVGGACAVADHTVGNILNILERKNLLDDTVVLIYGDHGDDYWTHGFKTGLLHAVEPYTHVLHAPLIIHDTSLQPGYDRRIASTVDLMPTVLELVGLTQNFSFAPSGRSLIGAESRSIAFSQNFTANQPDNLNLGVRKSFVAISRSHALLVNSAGLELFNHRLDPTNHCNLLHFFDLDEEGSLQFNPPPVEFHPHFKTAIYPMLGADGSVGLDFKFLHREMKKHINKKHQYIRERAEHPHYILDPNCLDTINRVGREQFFGNKPLSS